MTNDQQIIFYDGQCRVCNLAVGFVIRHDRMRKFHFSSLQSDAASEVLPGIQINKQYPESIVYFRHGKIYQHSTAVLRICRDLGRGWQLLYLFIAIPAPARDLIYRLIARNRYKWFGKNSVCPIIPKESQIE
jgi:predicted DCC family thiol-disulfide oxidoreductase YuxK